MVIKRGDMIQENWEEIEVVNGEIQAEIIRGLLEAQGISVLLSKEGAGRALGLSVGRLGETLILVPSSQKELALKILQDYYAGKFMDQTPNSEAPEESEDQDFL